MQDRRNDPDTPAPKAGPDHLQTRSPARVPVADQVQVAAPLEPFPDTDRSDPLMPRSPMRLTEAQTDQIEGLASVLSQEQMADYFGIARNTLLAIMEREPEIRALYKKGRAKAIGAVAQGLLQKARGGDTTSAIFYLKTQAGWREVNGPAAGGFSVVISAEDAGL